jgi:hypothetical protein
MKHNKQCSHSLLENVSVDNYLEKLFCIVIEGDGVNKGDGVSTK